MNTSSTQISTNSVLCCRLEIDYQSIENLGSTGGACGGGCCGSSSAQHDGDKSTRDGGELPQGMLARVLSGW